MLGQALGVGEWESMWDTGKGVGPTAWIEGSQKGVESPSSALLDASPGMSVP